MDLLGEPEAVADAMRVIVDAAIPFIRAQVATGCEIPRDTPAGNMRAFSEAVACVCRNQSRIVPT